MGTEVRRAKKDVLADLVSLKYDVQAYITSSSLRKAVLTSSEDDVRADMSAVLERLRGLLTSVYESACVQLTRAMRPAREKVNDEIIFLEELHKR